MSVTPLRPYQRTAIESALQALSRSGSAVLQMPTGAGKTRAATEIVSRAEGPVWFICHRQEIERQASKAFAAAGVEHGFISPRAEPDYSKAVQIVSVATLARRNADLPLPRLVVWDECHHVAAKSWAAIREALKDVRHLGLTATPERLDGKGLAEWFAELVPGPSIDTLIKDGWLSPFRYFAPSDPDLSAAKLQAGDYAKKDLAKVMNTPVLIGDAVAEYRRVADGRRAIAFCASVEASKALVERFSAEGVPALHVDGTTPPAERAEAVKALEAGAIKVLSNVEVFTEGFDVPGIEAAILMRPTKSPTLLLQMIGRALRSVEGKTAIIMDHAGLWQDHGSFADDWQWSLDGGAAKARRRAGERGPRRCPECKEVRAERVPVCDCGYEFPSGREIGEYDGVLTEVRGVVPEGWETQRDLSKRIGVTVGAVRAWIRRGLPSCGTLIPSSDATAWISHNVDLKTVKKRQAQLAAVGKGLEKQKDFAVRYGVKPSTVNVWVKKGLPVDGVGFVITDKGEEWVATNINLETSRVRSARASGADGFLNLKEFARRHGSPSSGQSWVKCGLPITDFGVPVRAGDAWVSEHKSTNTRSNARQPVGNDGTINRTKFSAIARVTTGTVLSWIRSGMPSLANGRINFEEAREWASRNLVSGQIFPFWLDNVDEFESRSDFAKRVRSTKNTVTHWAKRGLPCANNGWVHVLPALKWVKDHHHFNRKYSIPPEAWPKDNDNTTHPAASAA